MFSALFPDAFIISAQRVKIRCGYTVFYCVIVQVSSAVNKFTVNSDAGDLRSSAALPGHLLIANLGLKSCQLVAPRTAGR